MLTGRTSLRRQQDDFLRLVWFAFGHATAYAVCWLMIP